MKAEPEDKSASEGRPVVTENEETARRECQTSDRQASDQRCEPVERGRAAAVLLDDDGRDGVARIDRVWDGAAIRSAGDDRRLRRRARVRWRRRSSPRLYRTGARYPASAGTLSL
jgi:hypothetical protein